MAAAMAPQPHPATASLGPRTRNSVPGYRYLVPFFDGYKVGLRQGRFPGGLQQGETAPVPVFEHSSIEEPDASIRVPYSSTYHLPKYCGMVKGAQVFKHLPPTQVLWDGTVKGAQAPQCTRRLITQASLGMRIPTPGGPNERITLRFSVRKQYLLVHSDSQGLVFPPLALFVYGCSPLSNSSGTL